METGTKTETEKNISRLKSHWNGTTNVPQSLFPASRCVFTAIAASNKHRRAFAGHYAMLCAFDNVRTRAWTVSLRLSRH